jgi:hypothetical protein
MTVMGRRAVILLFAAPAIVVSVLMAPMNGHAQTVTVSDSFTAGTVGNTVVFEISNNTGRRVSGVRMTPEFPLRYCTLTGITPKSAALEPGESVDFTIEFFVHTDAPDGAEDSITLFFETNEKVEFDNPRFQINIDIVGADEKQKHNTAYFKVLVQGSGYTFTYGDGTHEISGSEERYIVVQRGQSAREILEEFKESIDGVPCERVLATYVEGEVGAPHLFTRGSQVTIIEGPFYNYQEFFYGREFKKNWQINGKSGPHPAEMAKRIKCQ